jgi:cholesterol oxidase
MPRATCRLCGECDLGCNDGAKNTLDHTYLSAARHRGADIRVRHEVKGFRPVDGGGYEVVYVVHTAADGEPGVDLPTHVLRCNRLVLAAGTFGTALLLLRNRASLPGLSDALGRRFSGNGDLLGLVIGAAKDGADRELDAHIGPVITSAVRIPDAIDGDDVAGRGHYVQDAGYPPFGMWLAETAKGVGMISRAARFAVGRVVDDALDSGDSTLGADLATLLGDGRLTASSLPLLGMGRDIPDGVLRIDERGRLAVDWTIETSTDYFHGVRQTMRAIAAQLGGTFVDNPLWWAQRVITVHPIGGASMGRSPGDGLCDAYGEVFGHPGLYVMDGALLPGPVGPNPSLTIAAVADRACTRLLETWPSGSVPAPTEATVAGGAATAEPGDPASDPPAPEAVAPGASGLRFTEKMKGFAALHVDDPRAGFARGKENRDRLMFELTISVDDIDRFVAEPERQGSASGYVESELLGGRLEVERGWFNLFVEADDPDERQMLYRLWLTGPGGNPLTFAGVKQVRDEGGLDVWRDTSTLYVTVREGHLAPGTDDGDVVAAGIITIHVPDFMKQLTTFRTWGDDPVRALEEFGTLFLGQLWDVYGGMVSRDEEDRP